MNLTFYKQGLLCSFLQDEVSGFNMQDPTQTPYLHSCDVRPVDTDIRVKLESPSG